MAKQLTEKIKHFDKVVLCLAIQLPEEVYDDVQKHWDELKQEINSNE